MLKKNFFKQFNCDSKKYMPVAAWALNDNLDNKKISNQIKSFHKLGYGGVMIIPWGGLPNRFMDDAWMNSVECIVKEANASDLEVWIWDDWCFPSGFGGGFVGKEKKFRAKRLKIFIDIVFEEGENICLNIPVNTLSAAYFNIDKFNNVSGPIHNIDTQYGDFITLTAKGRQRVVVVGWEYISAMEHTVRSHSRYLYPEPCDIYSNDDRDAWSVDMLNPDATSLFINLVHEKYFERLKDFFGTTIKGFFYDEPHLPSFLPWSDGLAERFFEKKGYSIFEYLVPIIVKKTIYDVIFNQIEDEQTKKVRSDYVDVWTDMVKENFYGKIHSWCKIHGVVCTGHHTGDESLSDIVSRSGMFFKIMDELDMPGVDAVFRQIEPDRFNDASRLAGSVRHTKNIPLAMSESLAVMGHSVYPDFIRFVSDYQIVRGINKFFYKLSNYNPEKSWYFHPPELSEANPLIRNYGKKVFQRISQICQIASNGISGPKVCVYIPHHNYYIGEGHEIALVIESIAKKLIYNQIEFDYIWEENLVLSSVYNGEVIINSDVCYKCLIIPEKSILSDYEIDLLRNLAEKGANIILPEVFVLHGNNVIYSSSPDEIISLIREKIKAYLISIKPGDVPISILTRVYGNYQFFMLLNESSKHIACSVAFKNKGDIYFFEQNSGCLLPVGRNNISFDFEPSETKVVILSLTLSEKIKTKAIKNEIKPDNWKLILPSGTTLFLREPFPSWNNLGYQGYSGFMTYYAEFVCKRNIKKAILTLGRLCYAATVFIDNKKVDDIIFTPFMTMVNNLAEGRHLLKIKVINTPANNICGDEKKLKMLEKKGFLNGTYAPIYLSIDRQKLESGLFGPVRIYPIF